MEFTEQVVYAIFSLIFGVLSIISSIISIKSKKKKILIIIFIMVLLCFGVSYPFLRKHLWSIGGFYDWQWAGENWKGNVKIYKDKEQGKWVPEIYMDKWIYGIKGEKQPVQKALFRSYRDFNKFIKGEVTKINGRDKIMLKAEIEGMHEQEEEITITFPKNKGQKMYIEAPELKRAECYVGTVYYSTSEFRRPGEMILVKVGGQ